MSYLRLIGLLCLLLSFNSQAFECARSCFVALDKVCNQCKECDTCDPLTPRRYIKSLEHRIFNDLQRSISKNPKSKTTLEKIKAELFNEWGIDPNQDIPENVKVPGGVLAKGANGKLEMSLNSQLARKILINSNSDENLISMAKRYLDLTDAGSNVDQQFRREFQKTFKKQKGSRSLNWNECFKYTNNLSIEDKKLCLKVDSIVDRNYFKNNVFRYYLPIDQFNPRVENSGAVNPKAFYSPADEGLKDGGSHLLICQKRIYAEVLPFEREVPCNCDTDPEEPGAFSDQIREIQYFSTHPSSRFLDLLRLEAIREHLRNYTNLTGELPDRRKLNSCNKPYGKSLNNLYEMGAEKFNPEISSREKNYPEIAKRNRSMIQHLYALSYRAKKLFEVEKQSCMMIDDDYHCTDSSIWKKNKKAYQEINNKIQTILNEFPLLGEQVGDEGEKYAQVFSNQKKFEKLLKISDKKLLQKRKKVLRKNIIKSLNKFCDLGEEGFSSDDLIMMKGLRSITAKHFPGNKFVELGRCLEEMLKRKAENEQFLQRVQMIGCAGVSLAAGILTSYAGGSGGVATAIGLGCFGYETSVVYDQYHRSSVQLENINGCMISSPDLPKGEITRICGSKEWESAKQRYEQAAFDLHLQVILSPLEIFPVIGDIKAARSASKSQEVYELLSKRDDIIDEILEADRLGDSAKVGELESSVSKINEDLQKAGVTPENLKVHYQNKGLGLEDSSNRPSSKIDSNQGQRDVPDSDARVTMDDPEQDLPPRDSTPQTLDDPEQDLPPRDSAPQTLDDPEQDLPPRDDSGPLTLDDPEQDLPPRESGPQTLDDPELSPNQNTSPERPSRINKPTSKRRSPHPLDVDFFNKSRDEIFEVLEKKLIGLTDREAAILKSLDRGTLARIDKFVDQGGDYRKFAKKLLSSMSKHQSGTVPLSRREIEGLAFNILEILKSDKVTGEKFLKLLTKREVTLHTVDKFIKNCRKNRSCKDIMRKLETRLKTPDIQSAEISLLQNSPGPYMEYYIKIAEKEPLGKFLGKGGYGAVFCRGNRPSCDQIIKIPLDFHGQRIYDLEIELAQEYLKYGRAAKILSDPDEVIMIKEFIGGQEAGDILFAGKNYTSDQVDDIVELFFDLRNSRIRNPDVLRADIKGNNLKWDPRVNKWVFVDTGARSPRNMFDNPDHFFEAFGKEFFFPAWVGQSEAQLKTSIKQWKRACKAIISRLIGSNQVRLAPMCNRGP